LLVLQRKSRLSRPPLWFLATNLRHSILLESLLRYVVCVSLSRDKSQSLSQLGGRLTTKPTIIGAGLVPYHSTPHPLVVAMRENVLTLIAGIALFTYHKYRKTIDSPMQIGLHGEAILQAEERGIALESGYHLAPQGAPSVDSDDDTNHRLVSVLSLKRRLRASHPPCLRLDHS